MTDRDHRILTINTGSSSVKFSRWVVGPAGERVELRGSLSGIGAATGEFHLVEAGGAETHTPGLSLPDHETAFELLRVWLAQTGGSHQLAAVSHRVVHGGTRFMAPAKLTGGVLGQLRQLIPLAPAHLPMEIRGISIAIAMFPGIPQVLCFDTAFHRDLPPVARRFPIGAAHVERGVLRYGFHGLSYEFVLGELARRAGEATARGRVVIAHLGNGCSLAAIRDGRSIETTMGLTPTSGIPMSTRSGDLDPGVVLDLVERGGLTPAQARAELTHRSGLLGLSGRSGDMRELLALEADDPAAALAVTSFCYHVRRAVASLAAALEGLDTLVFTGGIGERSAVIRQRVCWPLRWLGVALDEARNRAGAGKVSTEEGAVGIWVIPTDEERMLARHAARVVAA